jgi:hypothetical protein
VQSISVHARPISKRLCASLPAVASKPRVEAREAASRYTLRALAKDIACPLLVVHGDQDKTAPVGGARWFHAAAGSRDKTLVVYEGGKDGPIKPGPVDPPPPPPAPVAGTIELQADGPFASIDADGFARIRVYGWAEGGYLDITGITVQVQPLGLAVRPPLYFPGAYVAPGRRFIFDQTIHVGGPADVGVTLEMRDGSVVTYRRLVR